MEKIELKNYSDILADLEKDMEEKHLLICNGFNHSLGVHTSYENIFSRMKLNYSGYNKLKIDKNNCDLEHIIGSLKEQIETESKDIQFLNTFINDKVKFDFMKAAYSIVKDNIKNIYQVKSDEIVILFKNFSNYFTLNYDPLLYLLLMKFKKDDKYLAFANNKKFKIFEVNLRTDNDYYKVKEIWDTYIKKLEDKEHEVVVEKKLSELTKTEFENEVKSIFKTENRKYRKELVDLLYLDESNQQLEVNDGFQGELFPFDETNNQNVFFLHGAFHIYKNDKSIKKITQTQDKALYNRLEEIINSQTEKVVCVFTNENKEEEIAQNDYLQKSIKQIENIEGTLLIMGSSFDNNDKHIFSRINSSKVTKIYNDLFYGDSDKEKLIQERYVKLKELFPNKEIILFDSKSIFDENFEAENTK